jgi:hypothetical protein
MSLQSIEAREQVFGIRGYKGLQGVARKAYSPRLWLMAIGW